MKAVCATVIAALAAVSLYGCGGDTTTAAPSTTPAPPPVPTPNMTVMELIQATPNLSTFASLLASHGLTDALTGVWDLTAFAPTNDAFNASQSVIDTLTHEQIEEVLLYHFVHDLFKAANLTQGKILSTDFYSFELAASHNLTVQNITPDVIIHPDGNGAVDAKVVDADNMAINGVVHTVDAVLMPANTTMTISELVKATPTLSTLASLLESHNLADDLNLNIGDYTLFAPSDEAFARAKQFIATLPYEQVTELLRYHIHTGCVKAVDMTQGEVLGTWAGPHDLTVKTIAPNVVISPEGIPGRLCSDAKVITADNVTSNGVVHIVDAVLLPALDIANIEVV